MRDLRHDIPLHGLHHLEGNIRRAHLDHRAHHGTVALLDHHVQNHDHQMPKDLQLLQLAVGNDIQVDLRASMLLSVAFP